MSDRLEDRLQRGCRRVSILCEPARPHEVAPTWGQGYNRSTRNTQSALRKARAEGPLAHGSDTTKRDRLGAFRGVVFLSPARFEARCRAPDGLERRGSWEE